MKTKFILYVLLLAIVSIARCSNLEEEAVTDRHLEKGKFDSSKWDRAAYE